MSNFAESSFKDNLGVTIHTYSWLPENPKAVIQIAHGLGEHALRYHDFAKYLNGHGYAVYADDHRGHGETGREQHRGDLSQLGKLGPGGLRAAEEAIMNFTELIRSAHKGLKLAYFGHSWGSLMGQRIINRSDANFDAVVLSGSALRHPLYMESGDLNKHHKHLGDTGYEWLSRDGQVALDFASDELCFTADALKLFGLFDAMRLFGRPVKTVADIPMLIMAGTDDALSRKDSLERLAAAYSNRGVHDLTLRLYDGGRHEMLNETNKNEVYEDLVKWFGSKLLAVAA